MEIGLRSQSLRIDELDRMPEASGFCSENILPVITNHKARCQIDIKLSFRFEKHRRSGLSPRVVAIADCCVDRFELSAFAFERFLHPGMDEV